MKKLILTVVVIGAINVSAQQKTNENTRLAALKKETNPAVLKKKIKALENGTAEDLMVLFEYYKRDSLKKSAVTRIINNKYPKSNEAKFARLMTFTDVKGGAQEIEDHFKRIRKEYPNVNMDFEKNMVAMAYAELPDAGKVMEYINSMEDPVFKVAAITMSVELMAPVDQALALNIAAKELEKAEKLKGQTARSGHRQADPETTYNNYISMYSKLLFKAGRNQEAYKYTKEAYRNSGSRDPELTENYAFLSSLFDANYEEAFPILAKAVQAGKNERRYMEELRKGYQKLNPGKDVDAYIASLQEKFAGKIRAHVEKLVINEAAPDFSVADVNGKKVTLADFKGKTIVIDFWATWCGPCVASFPAMQMAANRYAGDPDVKFLFIHTWENVADPLTDARQFLSKRNYNFDLYMDPRDKTTKHSAAADAFRVKGIPAKFIIDGNGRIRFKMEGFSGTAEAAAEEVVQMVELARKGA